MENETETTNEDANVKANVTNVTSEKDSDAKSIVSKSLTALLRPFLLEYISTAQKLTQKQVTDSEETGQNIIIDKTLVDNLVNCFCINSNWEGEKIELLLAVKECFIRYTSNVSIFQADTMPFQEMYTRYLQSVLHQHLEETFHKIGEKHEVNEERLRGLTQYLDTCFNAFGQDILYMKVNEQHTLLDTSNAQLQQLDARLQEQNVELDGKISTLDSTLTQKQNAINEAIKTANESIAQQAQKVAESSITILGIFVGIVMVFFGDFSILSSAAAGLFDAPIYRLAIVLISFSAVLFNIIILLFYLISKLTQKTMGNTCPYMTVQDCKDCINCTYKPKLYELCRLRSTLPYVYWGNAVIVLLLIFTFCMYLFNGLYVELVPVTLRPFGILIQLSDTRSIQDMTFLQVLLSSVITVVAFVCLCKLGRPTQTKADTVQTSKQDNRENTNI